MPNYADSNVNNLIINKLTKSQFNSITPSSTQLYFVTDDCGLTAGSGINIDQSTATIGLSETYAGGTAVTLNGTDKAADTASFYAPTSGGTAKTLLVGTGATSAPAWSSNSTWSGSAGFLKVNANGVTSVDTNTYLTSHQSLANYVTLDTAQIISGIKTVSNGFGIYHNDGNPLLYFKAADKQKLGAIFVDEKTVNSKSVTKQMYLRQYSYNSTTGVSLEKWDQYYFPTIAADLNSSNSYKILTTKETITIEQGGTGATTAANARSNLGLGSLATKSSLAWNEITQSGAQSIAKGSSNVTDNTEIFTSYASNNGFADTNDGGPGKVYRREAIKLYNYIKNSAANTDSDHSPFNITGNAATATQWASAQKVYVTLGTASTTSTIQGGSTTAQTIGVDGTLNIANGGTGATSIAGARTNLGLGQAIIGWNAKADDKYPNSNSETTKADYCWFKVADVTNITAGSSDYELVVHVYDTMDNTKGGILQARFRTGSSITSGYTASLKWEYNNGYNLDDFKLVYPSDKPNPTHVELWSKWPAGWTARVFTTIRVGNRTNRTATTGSWVLYDAWNKSSSDPNSGQLEETMTRNNTYTVLSSSLLDIKNKALTAGTANIAAALASAAGTSSIPVYINNSGIPTAISNISLINSDSSSMKLEVGNTQNNVEKRIALLASTNRGLYDYTSSSWVIVKMDQENEVRIPQWGSIGNSSRPVYFNTNGVPAAISISTDNTNELSLVGVTSDTGNLKRKANIKISTAKSGDSDGGPRLILEDSNIVSLNGDANTTAARSGWFGFNTTGTSFGIYSATTGQTGYLIQQSNDGLYKIANDKVIIDANNSTLTLSTSTTGSPAIIFQRGTLTDGYVDWRIINSSGKLYFGQRGSNSSDFDGQIYFESNGNITATKFIGPLQGNADTASEVTQTAVGSTWTYWRPLIFGASNSSTEDFTPSTTTGALYATSVFSCQPSTGTIKATHFKGHLNGNADTASSVAWTNVSGRPGYWADVALSASSSKNTEPNFKKVGITDGTNTKAHWQYNATDNSIDLIFD